MRRQMKFILGNKRLDLCWIFGISKQKYNTYPDMSYSTYTILFNTCVAPVIDYGSSIWGFKERSKFDSVQ